MDVATIEACRAKVNRGEEDLTVLADKWRAWLKTEPYPTRVEVDTQTGWHYIYFDFSIPVPPLFSVIAGEVAHNLRSALDYLAWRQATEHIGLKSAESNAHVIEFPLKHRPAAFKQAQVLKYVGPDTGAIMERYQPYGGRNGQGQEALGLLHWFSVRDKHRAIHLLSQAANPFQQPGKLITADVRWKDQRLEISGGERLERETKIACYRFDPNGPEPNVRVQGTPHTVIGFGQVPQEYRGVGIDQSIAQVSKVIDEFTALIP